MKVLVTGGNGYIAKSLIRSFSDKYDVTSITRKDFDLSDSVLTSKWFENRNFDVVIHTAVSGGSRISPDSINVVQQNLMMYYNLLSNKKYFNKLISFGSGAELFQKDTSYGMSKHIISESIKNTDNFYNLRIFAVFDENELDRRFIKSNIQRYLKKEPIVIHENKMMDFFYMKDLVSMVEYYIDNDCLDKEVNCCYAEKYTLNNIADIINSMGDYSVPIELEDEKITGGYCGMGILPPIHIEGLKCGIQKTFHSLWKDELKKG
jgi:nucleoside-diphosphate-sugar epimerase